MHKISDLNVYSQPKYIRVSQACEQFSIGRTNLYKMLNEGRIRARKFGSRTLIDADSIVQWASSLPHYQPRA